MTKNTVIVLVSACTIVRNEEFCPVDVRIPGVQMPQELEPLMWQAADMLAAEEEAEGAAVEQLLDLDADIRTDRLFARKHSRNRSRKRNQAAGRQVEQPLTPAGKFFHGPHALLQAQHDCGAYLRAQIN